MLEPERNGGLSFVSVEEYRVEQAVERLKSSLPREPRECVSCGYAGETFRWGLKTVPARWPRRIALVLCCPCCETQSDLPMEETLAGDRP